MGQKLEPLGDRLIVRPILDEETRASGIVIPDVAKEKPQRGEVIAAGPGRSEFFQGDGDWIYQPPACGVGDVVLYSLYGGTELQVDGEKVLVLRESDVLARETT